MHIYISRFALVVVALIALSGCSTLRTLLPGGPTVADAQWSGVKTGEAVSILATVGDSATSSGQLSTLLSILGQSDSLGVLLPVTPIGSDVPRWILCTDEFVIKCKAIPLNAKVHFTGEIVGSGMLWRPERLTADDFND